MNTVGSSKRSPLLLLVALGAAALLLATLVAFLLTQNRRAAAVEEARSAATAVAEQQAVTLLSYDYRTVDRQLEQARAGLSGPFLEEYTDLTSRVVAPAAKQQQITTRADVVESAVVSAEPDRVVTLLFVNQTTAAGGQGARVTGNRVRIELTKIGDRWLVSGLIPI